MTEMAKFPWWSWPYKFIRRREDVGEKGKRRGPKRRLLKECVDIGRNRIIY
jgi:hypothetical protein